MRILVSIICGLCIFYCIAHYADFGKFYWGFLKRAGIGIWNLILKLFKKR